jgi:hypothetical protein
MTVLLHLVSYSWPLTFDQHCDGVHCFNVCVCVCVCGGGRKFLEWFSNTLHLKILGSPRNLGTVFATLSMSTPLHVQEIFILLWNADILQHNYSFLILYLILCQLNPLHNFTKHFSGVELPNLSSVIIFVSCIVIPWGVKNVYRHFGETWCIYFKDGDCIIYSWSQKPQISYSI